MGKSMVNFISRWLVISVIAAFCFLTVMAKCQESPFSSDYRPRLELEPRFNLNGGGFQSISASMTGGAGMETDHFAWHLSGTYNAARKVNDGDQPNPHGDIRSLGADIFGRTSGGWLFGLSGSYASLHTTNYDKVGWGLGIGGGKDFASITCPDCAGHSSMRLLVEYGIPTSCYYAHELRCVVPRVDVEQGVSVRVILPSPAEVHRHVFWDTTVFEGWIKTSQTGGYVTEATMTTGLMLRF
jgi:hypothetical protein